MSPRDYVGEALGEARKLFPEQEPAPKREQPKQINGHAAKDPPPAGKEPIKVFWHGEVDYRASRPQLVQNVIPEVGHGLIAGQWGTFKTFAAFDLAHSVMSGEPFLGYEVMRRSGVLFIAVEGASEVPIRLQGVIEDRGKIEGAAPFAWVETCPPLLGKDAADEICTIAEPVTKRLEEKFGVPLGLIIIDTVIAGAGYTKDGQDNDAAAGQAVMNTLKHVARRMKCFAFGVDHFGKDVQTGTRGTSAKEGSASGLAVVRMTPMWLTIRRLSVIAEKCTRPDNPAQGILRFRGSLEG